MWLLHILAVLRFYWKFYVNIWFDTAAAVLLGSVGHYVKHGGCKGSRNGGWKCPGGAAEACAIMCRWGCEVLTLYIYLIQNLKLNAYRIV